MASCPSCRRPVAMARATCFYCGADLPSDAVEAVLSDTTPTSAPAGRGGDRSLVVLDLSNVTPDALAQALSLPPYEAGLLARRRGLHLHRVLDRAAARAEAARLGEHGLRLFVVPEAEARVRPRRCLGGERGAGRLDLRTEEGPVRLRRGDVLLVVRGPIAREYRRPPKRRRVDTARLEEGYRVHLHPRERALDGELPRPVEIDALNFEFGFAATGSARLELEAWVEEVAGGAPSDDSFRLRPPALAPAEPEVKSALSAASSLGPVSRAREGGRDDGPVLLDNVGQFRFYSGWRAAVERRR